MVGPRLVTVSVGKGGPEGVGEWGEVRQEVRHRSHH